MKRSYEPKDWYIVYIGASKYIARKIRSIERTFGLKNIGITLRNNGFWSSKDGSVVVWKAPVLDYLPPKGKIPRKGFEKRLFGEDFKGHSGGRIEGF